MTRKTRRSSANRWRAGERKSYEIAWRRKDGEKLDTIIAPCPLFDEKGNFAGSVAVFTDITERKRALEEIRNSQEQLRQFAAHLQSIREEERTLLAREIHDELGQSLTGLKMDVSWLANKLRRDQDKLKEKTQVMSGLIDSVIQNVRKMSTELRPGVLDDLGLMAAIEWQAQEFESRTGIRCKFASSLQDLTLDRDRSTAVFRILQETLTNVARHAQAKNVEIELKETDNQVVLQIRDNGKGISESEMVDSKSLGLLGIKERAFLIGGEVHFFGVPGKGTTVTLQIPRESKDEDLNRR